ncbi:MAG: ATPase [Blastopirellula sp.]|nr:MAG: ATPase [Blastopirellula sp.]
MYKAYWKLNARPFENTTISDFYFPSESTQGALLKLRYAVENRRGVALLAGASGLGKSMLTRTLLSQLPAHFTPSVHLVYPQMSPEQLLGFLAIQLGFHSNQGPLSQEGSWPGVGQSIDWISRRLSENTQQGKHAVIAIDEAQLLADYGSLETLRLLSNLETNGQLDLSLLLVGQPGLLKVLDKMPDFEERLGVKCLLQALNQDETSAYVNHRLLAAGAKEEIFLEDALEVLYELTDGVPRRINRLCDLALLIGFAEGLQYITPDQIESVHGELVSVSSN